MYLSIAANSKFQEKNEGYLFSERYLFTGFYSICIRNNFIGFEKFTGARANRLSVRVAEWHNGNIRGRSYAYIWMWSVIIKFGGGEGLEPN